MDELISIRSGELSAAINPLGAELWSVRDAEGRELMTDADPAWWTGHAPLLFPIVGRLRDDRYRLDGQDYSLTQHGFARRQFFTLVERDHANTVFRLESDAESRMVYPFDFQLDVKFAIEAASLAIEATVTNRGDGDMPFSFGFHPAFAWPLAYGETADRHRIVFERDEPAPIRRISTRQPGLIADEHYASPVDGRELYPNAPLFADDALIWDNLASRSLTWGAERGPRLRLDFPDTPWLGIWQKPGARYLCIEPWAGMADPEDFTGDIWAKPGIMRLPAGNARRFRLHMTLEKN